MFSGYMEKFHLAGAEDAVGGRHRVVNWPLGFRLWKGLESEAKEGGPLSTSMLEVNKLQPIGQICLFL